MKPVMGCGHAANATRESDGAPVCAICYGIVEGADVPAETQPDLTGREAWCTYASSPEGTHGKYGYLSTPRPSSPNLAFFNHRPDQPHDDYYCGCWGWD